MEDESYQTIVAKQGDVMVGLLAWEEGQGQGEKWVLAQQDEHFEEGGWLPGEQLLVA